MSSRTSQVDSVVPSAPRTNQDETFVTESSSPSDSVIVETNQSSDTQTTESISSATRTPTRRPRGRRYYGPSPLDVPEMRKYDQLHVLVGANCERDVAQAEAICVRFSNFPKIDTRAIVDQITNRMTRYTIAYGNKSPEYSFNAEDADVASNRAELLAKTAFELCEWADLLVLAPIDANTMSKMVNGLTGNLLLEVLRSWDVSKKVILIPGMTTLMWENPMTKKQLSKIRRKWSWIHVMQPILWHFDSNGPGKCFVGWDGFRELHGLIRTEAELKTIGHDVEAATNADSLAKRDLKTNVVLPAEVWSLIFEHLGDWELAQALGVWTDLPQPQEWISRFDNPKNEVQDYWRKLEDIILTKPVRFIVEKLSHAPKDMKYLSHLCVKLIIKFCLTDVLAHLEANCKDILWASFGGTLLPTKASIVYPSTEILEWWRTSPTFLKKDYTAESMDGASKCGYLHVLEWWRNSGLTLKYSESALEQASGKGNLLILEWWKEASMHQGNYYIDTDPSKHSGTLLRNRHQSPGPHETSSTGEGSTENETMLGLMASTDLPPLRLKVGKSILAAAQNGQSAVIRWWDTSGIPYPYSESVAKIASAYGHVDVLETWKELKGGKFAMSFDNQVLVGPTKNGFVGVLEWWKKQTIEQDTETEGEGGGRLRVEYKTCDIEEALEDSVRLQGGEGEDAVRKWWAQNGLNLGVGTSEWMKVKVL